MISNTPKMIVAVLLSVIFWGTSATLVAAKDKPSHRVYAARHSQEVTTSSRLVRAYVRGIRFYKNRTHYWQNVVLSPPIRSDNAEMNTKSLAYLRWILHLWQQRALKARAFAEAYPWARMVKRTNHYRQCIIDTESRSAGMYLAIGYNGLYTGAYQYQDSTWVGSVQAFDSYFHVHITDASRAVDAPPAVQDAVTAYEIAAGGQPWAECRSLTRLASPEASIMPNQSLILSNTDV